MVPLTSSSHPTLSQDLSSQHLEPLVQELQAWATTFNRRAYIMSTVCSLLCPSLWYFTSLLIHRAFKMLSSPGPLFFCSLHLALGYSYSDLGLYFHPFFSPVLGIKPRALYIQVKFSTTELHSCPTHSLVTPGPIFITHTFLLNFSHRYSLINWVLPSGYLTL